MKKYYHIMKHDILESFSHVEDNIASVTIVAMILFIFLQVWTAIYAGKSTIVGFTIPQMIWYLAIGETLMFASGSKWIEKIGEEVQKGDIAMTLLKPVSYVNRVMALMTSNFIVTFLTTGIVGVIVASLLVGFIKFSLLGILLTVVTFLGSALISFMITICLGLLAFWFEDVGSIYFIYQKIVFILGGMFFPLDIYPVWIQKITTYLPTTYIIYYPAKLFVKFNLTEFFITFGGQIVWIIVLFFIMCFVYKNATKEVNVHGG